MKTKSFLHNFFLVTMTVCGMALIGITFEACQHHNGGTCTYEGLECPNALAEHLKDSLAYADAEYIIDSLVDSNDSLKTVIAGLELKDHSQITQVVGAGQIHMNHDKDGGINLVYREHDGNEYFLDYVIDDYFENNAMYVPAKYRK